MLRVRISADEAEMEVEIPFAPTVGGALARLEQRLPGTLSRLLTEDGRLRPEVEILVAALPVAGIATPLSDGQEIRIRVRQG
jgi:molybdopterin converting factor small subunit